MSWLSALSETYDNCSSLVGVEEVGNTLLPLGCSTAQAQLEITIDNDGNFVSAREVLKEEQTTIIIVTEDSATRSSGITPMPLCDKLIYIAGDCDEKLSLTKTVRAYFDKYMEQLNEWVSSPFAVEDVRSIYTYLAKRTVISDLMEYGIPVTKDDFVRFRVIDKSKDTFSKGVWEKEEIIESFQKWYFNKLEKEGICYSVGKSIPIATKHPGKIRNSGDKAKIISSNDTSNFTFRGRFVEAEQAVQIGYETTQKAHNALRWLINKQGKRLDSEYIVCWADGNEEIPDWSADTLDIFDDEEIEPDTAERYAKRVNRAMQGYREKLDSVAKIYVMGVDTADGSYQGRLAITYYAEFYQKDFFDNLGKWHIQCMWQHGKKKEDKYVTFLGAPSAYEIVQVIYGIEQEQSGVLKLDDKIKKKGMERLLPCIIEGKRFPKDMLRRLVQNAGEPMRYSPSIRRRVLEDACSIIRKCHIDDGKEDVDMALQEDYMDRDYLFGRLLATLNRMEEVVNYKNGNSDRPTNAIKYWSTYTRKPAKTFEVIRERLNSYIAGMGGAQRTYYSKLLEEILGKLETIGGYNNNSLREDYLLGYYSQMDWFRNNKKDNMNEKEENENE